MINLDNMTGETYESLIGLIYSAILAACKLEGIPEVDVDVRLTDNYDIRSINRQTRGIDKATDVLSFPTVSYQRGTARDNQRALMRETNPKTGQPFAGDIIISLDKARSQAEKHGHSETRELLCLFIHGFLHLLGYDHVQKNDRAAMRGMEESVLSTMKPVKEYTYDR